MTNLALLVLEDGTTLRGTGFGANGETFGEMVFNTGMTGYQETLTDPSYCGQIVAMTAPHIGNTGVNDEDPESHRIWVSGYVVREPARLASSWRARRTLDAELKAQDITGIAVPGTRALTMRIREHGAMRAAVSAIEDDPARLLDRVLDSPGMTGADLARIVTTPHPYTVSPPPGTPARYRVAAVDLGIKASTPRNMAARGMEVRVLPATVTAGEILAASPDGVFFSCFGSQILSLAIGLTTYKLRYGHRGVNQPVLDLATGRVYITSHNHGFAAALPPEAEAAGNREPDGTWAHVPVGARTPFDTPFGEAVVSHVNLNDGVVEGIRLLDRPAFSVQYHPEAAPGPHDAVDLFDQFATLMDTAR